MKLVDRFNEATGKTWMAQEYLTARIFNLAAREWGHMSRDLDLIYGKYTHINGSRENKIKVLARMAELEGVELVEGWDRPEPVSENRQELAAELLKAMQATYDYYKDKHADGVDEYLKPILDKLEEADKAEQAEPLTDLEFELLDLLYKIKKELQHLPILYEAFELRRLVMVDANQAINKHWGKIRDFANGRRNDEK